MPGRRQGTNTTRARGPALDFDARYVECAIEAWLADDLSPISPADLSDRTRARVEALLTERTALGMSDERVSMSQVTKAVALLRALKLARLSTVGRRETRVQRLTVTPDGRAVLSDPPATGGVRTALVSRLVAHSPQLTALLSDLEQLGPLTLPLLHRLPRAPQRGAAYTRAVVEGLEAFQQLSGIPQPQAAVRATGGRTPSVSKLLADAQAAVLVQRSGANVKNLEAIVGLASVWGLVWKNTHQLNDNVAARTIGLAAIPVDGGFIPRAPSWPAYQHVFVPALIRAHKETDNGSGFAAIDALRGSLGRALNLAPPVVDALICEAREAGERREVDLELQFEENEDLLYRTGREPLYWRQHAFDVVDVYVPATAEHPASR